MLPLPMTEDIPVKHYNAFVVCNNTNHYYYKKSFYVFKYMLLQKYGHFDQYDLQVIKKTCWSCEGTGKFKCSWKPTEFCWSCGGGGIYETKNILLKRYILNDNLFHLPAGRYNNEPVIIINKIDGYIIHKPIEGNATYAFFYLLWHYDKEKFFKCLMEEVAARNTRAKHKIKQIIRKATHPLRAIANIYKVNQKEQDELPF